ncbi:hypothetical protein ACHWQZ_G000823 [Mnemiopsis leidyi]
MMDSCVLEVGTEVSAKYRGAFCEATIKHVKKLIKIRIAWNKPLTGSATVTQENIRGVVKVQSTVEAKRDNVWCAATVLKITDASTYTVVFDDGDERTLGRNCVCPQGAKHFNEEWTLDHLPLTNPENFGTPVIMESKKQRKRRKVDGPDSGRSLHYSEEDVGKVAFYDTRSKKQTLVPVLIASHSQCDEFISTNPGEVIVRSFKSGKFMSIPKEDMLRFDRGTEPLQSILTSSSHVTVLKPALEKALAFYDTGVLPLSWETDSQSLVRVKQPENLNNTKLKKQFDGALHEFWEKKGSPITRSPSVGYHDLDLYQLHCFVADSGGPDIVTQNMKWRSICAQMNILNLPPSGSHTVKNAYCRYVVPFLPQWEKRRSSVSESTDDKKKGRITPQSRGRRTPTLYGKNRRSSLQRAEDGESSDFTDYEQMPDVHKYSVGQRVKVLYGAPKACGSYEAKINDKNVDNRTDKPIYHIHYTGWNTRYDEWITEDSIVSLVTRSSKKKGTLLDPPKDVKNVPNRRKIVPKYKKCKKQHSASETSSDDKNSLPASENSEAELDKQDNPPEVKEEPVEEGETAEDEEEEEEEEEEKTKSKVEPVSYQHHTTVKVESSVVAGDVSSTQAADSKLLCEEKLEEHTVVTSTQHNTVRENTVTPTWNPPVEEDKARKEEAAAILMTFPSTFAMKPGDQVHSAHILPPHLQLTYPYPSMQAVSPNKETVLITSTTGVPTQYLATTATRSTPLPAAGMGKLPVSGHCSTFHTTPHYALAHQPSFGANKPSRLINKPGNLVVVSDTLPSNITSMLKIEDKKKNRKRKIQQADSTSDIGSRLQQFDFRPDPCEDCDKRPEERPRRTERDKARRGTVKNSEGSKLPGSGERNSQQPPYWVPGSVGYVRGNTALPLYYSGADIIQGGYYVPMRPPGMGPYPPGYTPKYSLPTNKPPTEKDNVTESTLAEPDSTVCDEKPCSSTQAAVTAPPPSESGDSDRREKVETSTSYSTPPYCTPPHNTEKAKKTTPNLTSPNNLDSDSSDEKNTVPGMSPMIFANSTSECSDKEGSTSKVKIFDKDFGIHLFEHLELPDKIRSMQSTMAELQKCYLFYKSQIAAIEKKERDKRKSKKRRKSKQRTSSISKNDKSAEKSVAEQPSPSGTDSKEISSCNELIN